MSIERAAIVHRYQGPDAFYSKNGLYLRLFAKKGNLQRAYVHYGDRASSSTPVPLKRAELSKAGSDGSRDIFETLIPNANDRVFYAFELVGKDERLYFLDGFFRKELANRSCQGKTIDNREEFFSYPMALREEIASIPDWWLRARVYNVFPDSFIVGEREKKLVPPQRVGGRFQDIERKLPYIKSLGFDCLYLNPIFKAASYHRYDTTEYFSCDESLGGDGAFLSLVNSAHRLGIRVVIDGVFNHTGTSFFAFKDIVEKGRESPYLPWYYRLDFPLIKEDGSPNYACFGYCKDMPKLDTSNPEVISYFASGAAAFTKRFGIDGWRLDVANEASKAFWRSFRREVKKANPEAVFLAEIWNEAVPWLSHDLFDSTMNYEFARIARSFFAYGELGPKEVSGELSSLYARYAPAYARAQLNLLDSHDVPRFLSLVESDERKMSSALALLFLFPGVPSLFYGDEMGLTGVKENEYRRAMEWKDSPYLEAIASLSLIHQEITTASSFRIDGSKDRFKICFLTKKAKIEAVFAGKSEIQHRFSKGDGILYANGCANGKISPFGCVVIRKKKP